MNKSIRRLALFAMVLFGVLLANVTWIQAFQAPSLREHPRNSQTYAERLTQERGAILAGNEEIATSEKLGGDSDKYQRKYKDGNVYSPVTGTFRTSGESGIEKTENSLLDGTDDRLAVSNFMDTLTGEEKKGASVELTVKPKVQQAAMDGLRNSGFNGAAVALDPKDGAILGSATYPSFDSNDVSGVKDSEKSAKNWEKLSENEKKPLLNRGMNEVYPPGSTFKPVVAAAALEDGASPTDEQEAPDELKLPGPSLRNAHGESCNGGSPDTLEHSMEMSCNTAFANWAIDVGADKMTEQATNFGFNKGSIDTPVTATESKFPKPQDKSLLGRAGIGQADVQSTPLQMAMVSAGIANGGDVMKPYLVNTVKDSDLSTVEEASPEVFSEATSSSTADTITDMMVKVTEGPDGTGSSAKLPGMQVAAKTGTAQNSEGNGREHAWFISFAPADDPQIAVAVVLEHGGSGGATAAPIAKSIMEAGIDQ